MTPPVAVLFKPSKDLEDLPGWGNTVLNLLRAEARLTSAQIIEKTGLSTTDVWVVIEFLSNDGKIEPSSDQMHWQLTKQQRIKDRKNASRTNERSSVQDIHPDSGC